MSLLMLPSSKKLTAALVAVAVVGAGMLVAGALEDYGPLYLAGGIWIGFVFGIQLYRSTVKSVLRPVVDDGATATYKTKIRPDDPEAKLYRVKIVSRETGYPLAAGAAIFAESDIEAYETLRREYPHDKYKLFDRATGQEVDLEGR